MMLSTIMQTVWITLVILVGDFGRISGFFDVDEINSVNYGIAIASEPIVAENAPMGGTVFLTSKYGQQYHCSFSEKGEADQLRQKEEEEAMETGIAELLKPMEKGPCLSYTKGWWTYEFCFGQHIKQYHVEDGKITSAVMYLGHYARDFDWSNTTNIRKQRSWISRYHSQEYVNGTQCDLTTKARKTTVKFFCENSQGDYISRIDETETCVYTLTVQTPRICKHPYLKAPQPNKAVPITCNPLLSAEQYQEYLETLEPPESLMESTTDTEESTEMLSTDADAETAVADTVNDASMDNFQQMISKSLIEGLKGLFGDAAEENVQITNMKMNTLQSPGDIDDLLKKILTAEKKKLKSNKQLEKHEETEESDKISSDIKSAPDDPVEDAILASDKNEQTESDVTEEIQEEDDAEDEDLLWEFDKELDDIVESDEHLQQIKKYQDQLQEEITNQFDDILKEVEEEFHAIEDETEIDSDTAIATMKDTLKKLMKQLQDKKISVPDNNMPVPSSEETDKKSEKDEAVKSETKYSDQEDTAQEKDSVDEEKEEEDDDTEVEYVNMEYDLALGGNKIQVKIYTSADSYEEATGDMLENGAALGKMIVAVLGANTDEIKEIQRQEKMEDNYNFVWKADKKSNEIHDIETDENTGS